MKSVISECRVQFSRMVGWKHHIWYSHRGDMWKVAAVASIWNSWSCKVILEVTKKASGWKAISIRRLFLYKTAIRAPISTIPSIKWEDKTPLPGPKNNILRVEMSLSLTRIYLNVRRGFYRVYISATGLAQLLHARRTWWLSFSTYPNFWSN